MNLVHVVFNFFGVYDFLVGKDGLLLSLEVLEGDLRVFDSWAFVIRGGLQRADEV